MCQIIKVKFVQVYGVGMCLIEDMLAGMYNYGYFYVIFNDGLVGWYEVGWGLMMSEIVYFVKDVIGLKGSVSIVMVEMVGDICFDDINVYIKINQILFYYVVLNDGGFFVKVDEWISIMDELDYDDFCECEQCYFLWVIQEDFDLMDYMNDVVCFLCIVFVVDEVVCMGWVVMF